MLIIRATSGFNQKSVPTVKMVTQSVSSVRGERRSKDICVIVLSGPNSLLAGHQYVDVGMSDGGVCKRGRFYSWE